MSDSSQPAHISAPVWKPTWDLSRPFDWNYSHGPLLSQTLPQQPVRFLSWNLRSPLGVAAGPLLNAGFVKAYAHLGYSLLTYKTVRSRSSPAHPEPVLARLRPLGQANPSSSTPLVADRGIDWSLSAELSSANSVGLPSHNPEQWREDVRHARESISHDQVLIVSVAGTFEADATVEQLAEDFASCAQWAVEAGADMIEVNLSCPNVFGEESDVYLDPGTSKLIVEATHASIGRVPLSAKLGYYDDEALMQKVLLSITPSLDALTLINAVKCPVIDTNGHAFFPGKGRELAGVGGAAIRMLAQNNVRSTIDFLKQQGLSIPVIAVGGVTEPNHVDEYLGLEATAVAIATAAIWRPFFPYDYARYCVEHMHSPELTEQP